MGYVFVGFTVRRTVYGRLILKWQVGLAGAPPAGLMPKALFLASLLLNPWVMSGLGAAFAASLAWMLALTRLPLSSAYPLTSASFLLVLFFGVAFLGESLTVAKIIGTTLVILGILVMTRFN